MSTPKRVNGLAVITHHHDVSMAGGQISNDVRLETVGILILVHQYVTVPGRKLKTYVFMLLQQTA